MHEQLESVVCIWHCPSPGTIKKNWIIESLVKVPGQSRHSTKSLFTRECLETETETMTQQIVHR